MAELLTLRDISCVRQDKTLFADLSLQLSAGDVLQIKGVNGAGKTSLLKVLCGLMMPASGEVAWNGHNIHRHADYFYQDLLYIGHQVAMKRTLTVLENLKIYSGLAGQSLATDDFLGALYEVGLKNYEHEFVANLSAGQQRRVGLARLLLTQRQLWILDEPYTALDKNGVAWLENLFAEHCQQNGVIVMTTHQAISHPLPLKVLEIY